MGESKYQLALQIVGMVDQSLGKSVQMTKKQMKDLAKAAAEASKESILFQDAFNNAGPGIDKMWGGLKKAADMAASVAKVAGGAAIAGTGAAIKVGSDFESAMSSWAATANASEADYALAEKAAMQMGRSTSKTASESANALEYMALAGWSVQDSIKGLPNILRLSEATSLDLARTSDLVTDSMSATGVTVDELNKYLDVVAKANNKSNQTAEQLMEAYIGVGGTMKGLNVPIEESATALGVMANRGIKGSEAGNALSAVMINLTTGAGQAGEMMEKLGISAFDDKGKFIGLKATFERVNEATKNLTEEQRNAALSALGGKTHIDALNDLLFGLNTTLENGVTEWDALKDSLDNAKGSLEDMAKAKMDNLQGDLAILNSALEDTGIRFYKTFNTPLRDAVQTGTEYVYKFGDVLQNEVTDKLPTVRRELLNARDSISEFAEPLMDVGKWLIDNADVTIGAITGIAAAIMTLKAAKEINNIASGVSALIAALTSNPLTLAVTGAALLAGAVAGIAAKEKIAAKQAEKTNLAGHFGTISLSLEEVDRAAQQVLGKDVFGRLSRAMSAIEDAQKVADGLADMQKNLNRLSWKTSLGLELNESEKQEFADNIDGMIKGGIELVEKTNYSVDISVKTLFGDDDKTGKAILQSFDETYQKYKDEIRKKGEQVGQFYKTAMIDGMITPAEQGTIDRLTAEYAEMLDKVAQATTTAKMERLKVEFSGSQLDADSYQNLMSQMDEEIAEAKKQYEDSYDTTVGAAKLAYDESGDEETYRKTVEAAGKKLRERVADLENRKFDYGLGTVEESYRKEVDAFKERVPKILDDALKQFNENPNGIDEYLDNQIRLQFESDKATRDAIGTLVKDIQPQIDAYKKQAEELKAAGESIPKELAEAIESGATLEAMGGSYEAMYEVLGQAIANSGESEKYQALTKALEEKGTEIPEMLSTSIEENKQRVEPGINALRDHAKQELEKPLNAVMPVNVSLKGYYDNLFSKPGTKPLVNYFKSTPTAKKNALGSIIHQPTLTWVGEAGDDEGIIPINRSNRAAQLYNEVGRELKAAGNTGVDSSNVTVTYAPNITVNGNADEGTINKALASGYQQFKQYMERFTRDNRRLSY
jgi:TP901 family phage tail tape measure protein